MVKLLTPDAEITAQVLPGYKLYWAQVDDPINGQTYNVAVIREQLKVYTVYSGAEIEQGYRRCGYHCQCLDAWRNFTNLDFTCSHVKQVEETLDSKVGETERFLSTSGLHYSTPEEVVAFLNSPLEESDEAA
jgi:hypothetical protein